MTIPGPNLQAQTPDVGLCTATAVKNAFKRQRTTNGPMKNKRSDCAYQRATKLVRFVRRCRVCIVVTRRRSSLSYRCFLQSEYDIRRPLCFARLFDPSTCWQTRTTQTGRRPTNPKRERDLDVWRAAALRRSETTMEYGIMKYWTENTQVHRSSTHYVEVEDRRFTLQCDKVTRLLWLILFA